MNQQKENRRENSSEKQRPEKKRYTERFLVSMLCIILSFSVVIILILKGFEPAVIKDILGILVAGVVTFIVGFYCGTGIVTSPIIGEDPETPQRVNNNNKHKHPHIKPSEWE